MRFFEVQRTVDMKKPVDGGSISALSFPKERFEIPKKKIYNWDQLKRFPPTPCGKLFRCLRYHPKEKKKQISAMPEKIKPEDIKVERLAAVHASLLTNFSTDNNELKAFLVEDALKNQQLSISTTYLWFYSPTGELAAYISLLNDSLRIRETELEKLFVEKGILYKSLPALKIGRLCVDNRFAGRGIGTIITNSSMAIAVLISEIVGCRFVVLDSKKEAVNFYSKLGFKTLRKEDKEITPMYFDLMNVMNLYGTSLED